MFYMSGQRCIRPDQIAKELDETKQGCKFCPIKLTSSFISWLFRHYKVTEFSIHFYDSEPEIPGEGDGHRWWESPGGEARVWLIFRAHEEKRMVFCNWIDVFGPDAWGAPQKEADQDAKDFIKGIRSWPVSKKGRVFAGETDGHVFVYAYGRDFLGMDYWWALEKRNPKDHCKEVSAW